METSKHTSLIEEIANSVTHGLGLLLVIIGAAYLILINTKSFEFWRMFGISVFGLSVILTYTFSTLYHSLYFTKANNVFRKLDHSSIFLLIAGTYTPFILMSIKNQGGLILLLFLWVVSILAITYKVTHIFRKKTTLERRRRRLLAYLSLGWMGLLIIEPILSATPLFVVFLLVLGGFFYTSGTIFYVWRSLKFNHSIWHLFVLFGTTCHFLALLRI